MHNLPNTYNWKVRELVNSNNFYFEIIVIKILHTNSYIADPLMFSATTTKKNQIINK